MGADEGHGDAGQVIVSIPQRFRKVPVEIEAMRLTDDPESAIAIIAWAGAHGVTITYYCDDGPVCREGSHQLRIPTLEGEMRADIGDWIICGVAGEFYPCKPDIFEATYEVVE